ncbi:MULTISPECIES: hypothetical protein [unclassified Pseudomonas]|uniref:hypothetical protein n=1 Tax=unclassified Pseudomonas TaxID=196821 RepID=UPI0030DAFBD9
MAEIDRSMRLFFEGLHGYQNMLEANYRDIPDLRFKVEFLVIDPPKWQLAWHSIARQLGSSWGLR